MAKAYIMSIYRSISDPDALAAYAKLAGPAIEAAGGRFLVRGGRVEVREAGLKERTVLVEFDSFEQAVAAYDSERYGEALEKLGNGVERDFRIVEGIE